MIGFSRSSSWAAIVLAVAPLAAARGSSFSDEVGVSGGQSTPGAPRIRQLFDSASFTRDLRHGFALDAAAGIALVQPIPGVAQREFGTRGGRVLSLSGGLSYVTGEHVGLGLSVSGSPRSRLSTDTSVSYQSAAGIGVADALLSSVSSHFGASVIGSYDTAGTSDLELLFEGGVAANHFATEQRISAFRAGNGEVVTTADLRRYCTTHVCSRQLLGLMSGQAAALNQTEAMAVAIATVCGSTDVGLGGAYDFYDRDPASAGSFRLMSVSRAGFGNALLLAPPMWRVTPEATRRLGPLSARVWVEHGKYVANEGTTDLAGVKLEYRFAGGFRAWVTGTGQRDRDAAGNVAALGQLALGGMWLL